MIRCSKCDVVDHAGDTDDLPEGWKRRVSTMSDRPFLICGDCAGKAPESRDDDRASGDAAGDRLLLFLERIERLREEGRGINDDIKDVFSEAKMTGFDVRTMKQILKLREMSPADRQEADALLETYKASLGME